MSKFSLIREKVFGSEMGSLEKTELMAKLLHIIDLLWKGTKRYQERHSKKDLENLKLTARGKDN